MPGSRLPWIAARAAMAACVALAVSAAVLRVFDFSHLADYGEGTLLPMLARLAHEPASPAWLDGPPYTLTSYGPGYYGAVLAVGRLLPWQHSLIPGRLVSLAATLGTAGLVALVVGRRAKSGAMAAAAAVIYLASPVVQAWGTVHRVDPLATLLAVAAYVVLGRKGDWHHLCGAPFGPFRQMVPVPFSLVAAAVCVVLGSLVKQSVAITVLPLAVYLVLDRRPRAAAALVLLVAALGAAAWLTLDYLSGGFLFRTAVQANLGRLFWHQTFWAGHAFVTSPLGLVAAIVVGNRLVERPAGVSKSIYAVGLVIATGVATVLSAKEGAAPSYFLEASALAAIVIGLEGLAPAWSIHRGRTVGVVLVVLAAVLAPEARFIRAHGLRLPTEPYCGQLIAHRLGPGRGEAVLADGQHLSAVMQAGWVPLVNDSFLQRLLVDHGRMDPRPTVEAIEEGRVAWLVLKRPIEEHQQQLGMVSQKWSPVVLEAMRRRFVLDVAREDLLVFIYRLGKPGPQGR